MALVLLLLAVPEPVLPVNEFIFISVGFLMDVVLAARTGTATGTVGICMLVRLIAFVLAVI